MSCPEVRELDLAALRQDLPAYGLIAGDIGTVVFVHAGRHILHARTHAAV